MYINIMVALVVSLAFRDYHIQWTNASGKYSDMWISFMWRKAGGIYNARHVQCIRKMWLHFISTATTICFRWNACFADMFIFCNSIYFSIRLSKFKHFLIISFASTFLVELARTRYEPLINVKWDTIALASLTYFLL